MKEIIVLNSDEMGRGERELGLTLMGAFLKKLWAEPKKPEAVLFYQSAVKLLYKEAGHLEALHALAAAGVDLVACGTCINFFELAKDPDVGRVSGMEEIVKLMMHAKKVITI